MIQWGEEMRYEDPGYFCHLAIQQQVSHRDHYPVWLISDARRPTDLEYFRMRYCTMAVRIWASEPARRTRGWEFTEGVDDVDSECALDGITDWDMLIENDEDKGKLENQLKALLSRIRDIVSEGLKQE